MINKYQGFDPGIYNLYKEYRYMKDNSRLILIQDIRNFSVSLARISKPAMIKKWGLNPTEIFDDYLDWTCAHLLVKFFNINVINYHRKDSWHLCVFEENAIEILNNFSAAINQNDLKLLDNCKVKIVVTGWDLFIVKQISFNYF